MPVFRLRWCLILAVNNKTAVQRQIAVTGELFQLNTFYCLPARQLDVTQQKSIRMLKTVTVIVLTHVLLNCL